VVVFLVVVVVPVMGFLEVDSVTRAFCVVFLPARRERRLGLRVVVVGVAVVRVRAMMLDCVFVGCVEGVVKCLFCFEM
jgi:hypothetical protein